MRIHISLTPSDKIIPFNYQPMLTGAIHKWLRENDIHNDVSLYSFSWLRGADISKKGLIFKNGGSYFISSYDGGILEKLITGIQSDPLIGHGLTVKEIVLQKEPAFKNETRFLCASPVLVKRRFENQEMHYTYEQEESDAFLTETLQTKLEKAGLQKEGVSVAFDRSYHSPKTKIIYYHNIGNKVNLCPVKIKGTPEQLAFAWNVGVGNSTGIGFGALK